jgi:hypothetical protein
VHPHVHGAGDVHPPRAPGALEGAGEAAEVVQVNNQPRYAFALLL